MNNQALPVQQWFAVLVGCVPALSLLLRKGASTASFLVLLTALALLPQLRAAWRPLPRLVRWTLWAFLAQAALALLLVAVRGDPLSFAEKPVRMAAAAALLPLLLALRTDARALWGGAVAACVAGLVYISWERLTFGFERPGGQHNPIVFGDIALCLALVCAAAWGAGLGRRWNAWLAVGVAAGLAASLVTGSRGGWLGLALAGLAAVLAARGRLRRVAVLGLGAGLLAFAGAYLLPASGLRERVQEAVQDIDAFRGGEAYTRVGTRLELWQAALTLVQEQPLRGHTAQERQIRLAQLAAQGHIDARTVQLPHFHNDVLQVLASSGLPGLLAWLACLALPAAFFVQSLGAAPRRAALALSGLLVVAAYFGFGLTEVIFWSVNASLCYALLVFLFIGLILTTEDGK